MYEFVMSLLSHSLYAIFALQVIASLPALIPYPERRYNHAQDEAWNVVLNNIRKQTTCTL